LTRRVLHTNDYDSHLDSERVGIIGILKVEKEVEKTKNASLVSEEVAFTPEIETAARMVAELEAQGVDTIVLLSHVSNQTGPIKGGGHGGVEALDLGAYPTMVQGPAGDPVLVVTVWEYA